MRGSDFAELKAFAAVVERASFARAAEHLGLSPSAMSQTIRQLEARLGVRLLNRTTRSVAPTPAGARLHARLGPLMQDMESAVAEAVAAAGRTAGTLRINTLGMAARALIAPRLGRFHRDHPDVVLEINVDDTLTDIVAARCDAGIRVGGRLEKDMIAVRLTPDVSIMVVASPDYLARRGRPTSPESLHGHACVNFRLPGSGRIHRWAFEKRGRGGGAGQRQEITVEGPLTVDQVDLALAAALQGVGLVYAYERGGIDEAIADGRLVRVLADWSITHPGLFLYYPDRRDPQGPLAAFIDCLLAPP